MPELLYEDSNKAIYLDDPGEFDPDTGEVITPRVERIVYTNPQDDLLQKAVSTLQNWADDAKAVTVTSGNNTAVTQELVNRVGILCNGLATLIERRLI